MSVVYQIEALFVLFSVVLSILIRTKYFWIGMHMYKKIMEISPFWWEWVLSYVGS